MDDATIATLKRVLGAHQAKDVNIVPLDGLKKEEERCATAGLPASVSNRRLAGTFLSFGRFIMSS